MQPHPYLENPGQKDMHWVMVLVQSMQHNFVFGMLTWADIDCSPHLLLVSPLSPAPGTHPNGGNRAPHHWDAYEKAWTFEDMADFRPSQEQISLLRKSEYYRQQHLIKMSIVEWQQLWVSLNYIVPTLCNMFPLPSSYPPHQCV